MSGGFRRDSEREVHRGHVIAVAVGTFVGPDGERFERDVVHHPGAVAVVPVHDDGTVTLVRQYRAPLDALLLEIPAGKRDVDGEDPAVTARRELAEEVGLEAGRLEHVSTFHNSPGFSDELVLVYLAHDLTPCATARDGVEEESMEVVRIALDDVAGLVASGALRDAKTIIGLQIAVARR